MIGTSISHYEILERLGSGGMGVVYKARDTKLDRIVALKFLPPKVARDEEAKQRFMQEAKAASALDDPHICTIFEIGEADDGQLFIAMAYYDGSTLQDLIEKRKIKIDDAASIARQMAKGLSAAHEAGIVHRDVKPANVMVTRKGLVKLLDFGVAKLEQSTDLTREGSTIGTASYMSPEQARGEQVDARSDIWSIGAVLYEMLTGARPFGGGYEAAVAYSIINEDPPPIAPARPDTPDGLIDIVSQAMAKKPEERHPTARALADALGEYSGETIVETAPQPAYRPTASEAEVVPSLQKLVIRFAIGGALVLALVYATMFGLGLPDWVFPAAVFLTLIGLPITLYAATVEKQRARMDSGEKAKLEGLKAKLSTKLALRGGVIAAVTLIVAIIGYSGLRAAGIGPFASLITAGVLDKNDSVIVTDFDNNTDTAELGATVARALRIDLSQSTAVSVLDDARIEGALARMELPTDTLLSAGLAVEIAVREGVKAVINGEISSVGSGFQIAASVLSADSREQILAVRESASDESDILAAIDRLSAKLREEIGESLVSIRSNPPLEQVSTSSLDALRHYSRGVELDRTGRDDEALEAVEAALEADSLFGMAWRKKGILLTNLRIRFQERSEAYQKAFDLRDRMTEQERLLTEGTVWTYGAEEVDVDEGKAKAAYRAVLEKWPNEQTALNNLAGLLNEYNPEEAEEAIQLYRKALSISEGEVFRQGLLVSLAIRGNMEDHYEAADSMRKLYPNNPVVFQLRQLHAFSIDSLDEALYWTEKEDSLLANDGNDLTVATSVDKYAILLAKGQFQRAMDARQQFFESPEYLAQQRLFRPDFEPNDTTLAVTRINPRLSVGRAIQELTGDTTMYAQARTELEAWGRVDTWEEGDYLNEDGELTWRAISMVRQAWELDLDLDLARRRLDEVDSLRNAGHDFAVPGPEDSFMFQYHYVMGMTGDQPESHAQMLLDLIKEDSNNPRYNRDLVGKIWDRANNLEKAIEAYTAFVTGMDWGAVGGDRGAVAPIHFRLGELHEQQGNLDQAIHHYQKMVDRWKDADAILQPQVEEARRRIDQLLDRKAQEPS